MNLRPEDCRTFTFGDQQMNELFLEDLDRFRLGFGGRRLSEQRRGLARCGFPSTRFGARARLADTEIGRASSRERVCQYVTISGVRGFLKKTYVQEKSNDIGIYK